HERQEHLFYLGGVALNEGEITRQIGLQLNRRHLQLVEYQTNRAIDDCIQVSALDVHGRGSGEGKKILHNVSATPALTSDQFKALHDFLLAAFNFVTLEPLFEQLRVGENSRQGIVDLMRDNGGQLADRRHLFNVQNVIVSALQLTRLFVDSIFQRLGPG